MIGQTVSHYRVLEKLGEGGMGVVYRAEDLKLTRTVALKFLLESLVAHEPQRARFLEEARAAGVLNHPNICTIHDIQEYEGQQFIVMEYVEGKTLREVVPVRKIQEAIGYAIQIGEALHEAHTHGIVHRDIKSDNIMVNTKNQVKVMDFGLAKLKGSRKLSRTSSTIGTLAYMSPEQIQGAEADARSDIFSFGVVLFEMLTGRLPFRGEHEAAMLYSILNEQPEPLQKHVPDAPLELVQIIDRTLEKDPADRYQSIADLVIELQRLKRESSGIKQIPGVGRRIRSAHGTADARKTATAAPAFVNKKRLFVILAAVGLLFVAYAVWHVARIPASPVSQLVLVDVFENRTGDPSLDLVGRMTADWITQGLSQLEFVRVVPSPTALGISLAIRSSGHDRIAGLAGEAGASVVITGSYYRVERSLRLQTQITDAASGRLIQALEVSKTAENPMDAIEFMRQKVMGVVAVEFSPEYDEQEMEGIARLVTPPTYEAYREVIQGFKFFDQGEYGRALPYFQRASELDSNYAMAYIFLVWSYMNRGDDAQADSVLRILARSHRSLTAWERSTVDIQEACLRGNWAAALRGAVECARIRRWDDDYYLVGHYANKMNRPHQALEALLHIDAESRYVKDWPPYWGDRTTANHMLGNHEEELRDALHARKQNPTDSRALHYEIRALAALGKVKEIMQRIEESQWLPEVGVYTPGGTMRLAAQELRAHGFTDVASSILEQAIQWYRSKSPEEMGPSERWRLARLLYSAGRWDQAKEMWESLARDLPDDYEVQFWLGMIAARRGDREKALLVSTMLQRLKEPSQPGWNSYLRACIAAVLGEKEQAVELLRESFKQGNDYDLYLHRDIDLESLRDYPPFQELLKPKG